MPLTPACEVYLGNMGLYVNVSGTGAPSVQARLKFTLKAQPSVVTIEKID
jgi:hypothetical protein